MENDEVRIQHREDLRISVKVGVSLSSESNFFVGFTDNISEGGLFMATYELLPVGKEIELELRISDDEDPIFAQAEVRWHRSVVDSQNGELIGFGAKFIDVPVEDRARLETFLSEREPIFHPE